MLPGNAAGWPKQKPNAISKPQGSEGQRGLLEAVHADSRPEPAQGPRSQAAESRARLRTGGTTCAVTRGCAR